MVALFLATALSNNLTISVRVDGDGYLRLSRDGLSVYAKKTRLSDTDGKLTDYMGNRVLPTVYIPRDATGIDLDLEGNVYAIESSGRQSVGRLVLAIFPEGSSLRPNSGVLVSTDRPASLVDPGDGDAGVIRTDRMKTTPRTSSSPTGSLSGTIPAHMPGLYLFPDPPKGTTHPQQPTANTTLGTIMIAPSSSVTGEKILLGKVATIDAPADLAERLANVELGETPVVGARKVIDRVRVTGRLRAAGFNPEQFRVEVPMGAEVHCESQAIPASKFLIAAIGALQAKAGAASSWDCSDELPDFVAPAGQLDLKVENLSGIESGQATVVVAVWVDGRRFNSRSIHFKGNLPQQIKVPAGAPVKVILTSGHAQIEVPGITKNSASLGGTVQVEVSLGSQDSKTTHIGTLVQMGVVEVKLS